MEPLLIYPDPVPPELVQALDLGGYPWKAVADEAAVADAEPDDGWAGAIVLAADDPEGAFAVCRALRKRDLPLEPLLLLVSGTQLPDLELRDDLFDDFCLHPFQPRELEARLKHLFWRTGRGTRPELVEYGDLLLNLETYQAAIAGKPLDLTYMEYELLKFLASHPGKVFTRETLLSRVWGYEYYGGARTVDVHIRRLRAKLGEEHANLIQTVRSVGYRFGQSRWGDLMPPPVGPYRPIVRAGEWLVVSGQLGLKDGTMVTGGITAELRQAIANLEALLQGEGASLADVVKTTLFVRHLGSDFDAVNEAYVDCFGDHRPARSAIGVAELPRGGLVEIEAWARVAG